MSLEFFKYDMIILDLIFSFPRYWQSVIDEEIYSEVAISNLVFMIYIKRAEIDLHWKNKKDFGKFRACWHIKVVKLSETRRMT